MDSVFNHYARCYLPCLEWVLKKYIVSRIVFPNDIVLLLLQMSSKHGMQKASGDSRMIIYNSEITHCSNTGHILHGGFPSNYLAIRKILFLFQNRLLTSFSYLSTEYTAYDKERNRVHAVENDVSLKNEIL